MAAARRRRRRRPCRGRALRGGKRSRALAHQPHRRQVRRRPRAGAATFRRNARDARVPRGESMIRVLIVDDHWLLRAGLRSRLEREPGIAVVGEADTAERAVVMARKLQPYVILLDLLMPRTRGYEAIPELKTVAP